MIMRRVVVTDADGPTASILVSSLKRRGHHVTALTDEIANLEADRIIPKWTLSDQALFALQSAEVVIWPGRTYFLARATFERAQVRVADFVARGPERGNAKKLLLLSHLFANAKLGAGGFLNRRSRRGLAMLLLCIASLRSASAGSETIHAHGPDTPLSPPTLDVSQVVQWMAERNRERLDRLQLYAVDRHYQLEYRGFPKNEQASMDVHMISDDPTSKRFM